jgi:thioester reductase-like protein
MENLSRYARGAATNGATARFTAVAGDLERPRFGLGDDVYAALASGTDVVYHNGARVNHILGYDRLRATNVLGTLEALRFAAAGRPKPLHYTSTLAVFRFAGSEDRSIAESQSPDDVATLVNGYAQTKWAAERLLERAALRGAAVSVYRPGIVVGDATIGYVSQDDFLWRLVQASIALGEGPDSDVAMYLTPVDFAARAIVQVSRAPGCAGRAFHLVSPPTTSMADVLRFAISRGYPMRLQPPEAWLRLVSERGAREGPLAPYLAFLSTAIRDEVASTRRLPSVSTRNTEAALAGTDIRPPAIGARYLEVIFQGLVERGVLAPPAAAENAAPHV